MHLQSSYSDKTIKIFSGAFQPEKENNQEDCPPVYNVIELSVANSLMNVKLESRKWDGSYFIKYSKESKLMSVSLSSPDNWSEAAHEESRKETKQIDSIMIPINEINYRFINSNKQKDIINAVLPEIYDPKKSDRANCLLFLKGVREKGLYQQLLNELEKVNQ